ncbi:MAG: hypothetical protein FWH06_05965 [Oscillospiraceae bacterium]|nr:hypothetical protein [Oscillospiraceae bacterium]
MARGGRGGGFSGGGRSSGGGGGRSFGGRSGGAGSPGRGGFSGGFNGGSRGAMGGRPTPHVHWGPAYGRTHVPYRRGWRRGSPGCGCGTGCAASAAVVVIVLVFAAVMLYFLPESMSGGGVTASTIKREPLPRGSVVETDYYTDELGWIGNRTQLTAGMRNFYQKTGVQPHLYLTDTISDAHTPTAEQAEAFLNAKYDELFEDEAHLLLVFFERTPGSYHTWYLCGVQAKAVLDGEAMDILLDYIDRYYYGDMTDEEFFSKAFDDAGSRIMKVTTSPWIPALMVAGILIIIIIMFAWWSKAKKQKNLEAEQTKDILSTPLETFGTGDEKKD